MSNARMRDWQLKRTMMRPARVTNRAVGARLFGDIPDSFGSACRSCGYHICGCARKETAKPSAEPRLPAGWRDVPEVNGSFIKRTLRTESEPFALVNIAADGVWRAFRDCSARNAVASAGESTNLYAAMLCALGCEVEKTTPFGAIKKHEQWWKARLNGGAWCAYAESELVYEVERLTAERERAGKAPSESKHGKWSRHVVNESLTRCDLHAPGGGMIATYAERGAFSGGYVACLVSGGTRKAVAPASTPADQRRAWCEAQLDEREAKASAGPVEALAPGWKRDPRQESPLCQGGHDEHYGHETDAAAWRVGGTWYFARADSDVCQGTSPARDEAMARALGWNADNHDYWRCADPNLLAALNGNGTWSALRAGGVSATSFPSLPHAIAWARGDS